MCSARGNVALPTLGFPIRESPGQWLFSASPGLIAAVHALHRLLVPRHPPRALNILTVIGESLTRFPWEKPYKLLPVIPVSLATVQFSRSGKRRNSRAGARDLVLELRRRAGLSKLNSMRAASHGPKPETCSLPGPVDMLGRSLEAIGAQKGSLERR
jgi:hypothetical protein